MKLGALVLLAKVLLLPSVVEAHPLDMGYLSFELRGTELRAQLDLNPKAAEQLTGGAIDREALAKATWLRANLTVGGAACVWESGQYELGDQRVRYESVSRCPRTLGAASATFEWKMPFLVGMASTFKLLGRARIDGQEKVFSLDAKDPVLAFTLEPTYGMTSFIRMGLEHIGAAPSEWIAPTGGLKLPDGIDHILFLFALILTGGGLFKVLGTATGFTVGHSITLALSVLGIVRLPAAFIEPAIAFSIAFVAAEDFFRPAPKHRWQIATFFGLIHGFGFAAALRELRLGRGAMVQALFGFNLGVELGQIVIILAVIPFVILLARSPRHQRWITKSVSVLIFAMATYWFCQRTFA